MGTRTPALTYLHRQRYSFAAMSSVVRERDDGQQCWCQIRFDSGERVLISIAGKPTASVKVLRLALAGLIPVKTIWELTSAKVGGHDAYIDCFMKMFMSNENEINRPLRAIRNALLQCSSIDDARRLISDRESRVSG
jgi:hypothetical protein